MGFRGAYRDADCFHFDKYFVQLHDSSPFHTFTGNWQADFGFQVLSWLSFTSLASSADLTFNTFASPDHRDTR
jgi:hypothetical protein